MELTARLRELGAQDVTHVHGALSGHLTGVHDLLKKWGNREALCRAGLFHSIYGTSGFDQALVDIGNRGQIAELIGEEAEQIVYLFASCDRESFYPSFIATGRGQFRDRITGAERTLDLSSLRDLSELTMANELEIILAVPKVDPAVIDRFASLFNKMRPYVSDPAWTAWQQAITSAKRPHWLARLRGVFG